MKSFKKNLLLNKYIIFIFFFIYVSQVFKIPYNFHVINQRNYESRMNIAHGNCDKESYGFITATIKEFKIKKNEVPLSLSLDHYSPEIWGLLKPHKKKYNKKYIFILNYFGNFNDLKNKTISMNDHMINLNDYSLAKKFGNCYFWIKND
tara:strand:+ start:649 stop:1095 length:447 start_codon:yes stop_codon:yes gene_type:complete